MTLAHLATAVYETARISAPTIVQGLLGTLTAEDCDRRLDTWSAKLLQLAEVDLRVDGLSLAPLDETFVVMSNHQSLYDIPVMFQALRRRVRMVAKQELFKIPGWGPAMRMAGFVEVDRGDRAKAIRSLGEAKSALGRGTNIWIAPEGTRGPGGRELLPFKKGGFHLAIDTGARILPVSITGTTHVLSARGRQVKRGEIVHVRVHQPIAPATYPPEAREQLIADVRSAIISGIM
ncbi:MAG: lysophospholipid acyltransferase family protein [Polyangiales bacterium]